MEKSKPVDEYRLEDFKDQKVVWLEQSRDNWIRHAEFLKSENEELRHQCNKLLEELQKLREGFQGILG
jgi:hypothetical protein